MRKPNYFGTNLSKLRINGFLMAGLLGGATSLSATPGNTVAPRKRENTLTGTKATKDAPTKENDTKVTPSKNSKSEAGNNS